MKLWKIILFHLLLNQHKNKLSLTLDNNRGLSLRTLIVKKIQYVIINNEFRVLNKIFLLIGQQFLDIHIFRIMISIVKINLRL